MDDTQSFFVDVMGSNANAGTMAAPFATISFGIGAAAAHPTKKSVLVSTGTYAEGSTISLASGVSVYGQYNRAMGWARSASYVTTISGPPTAVQATNYVALGVLEGFTINAASAGSSSQNSIGINLNGAPALRIRNNIIAAGNGALGVNGTSPVGTGANGAPGTNGQNGSSGSSSGGSGGFGGAGVCTAAGGNGGTGSYSSGFASNGGSGSGGAPGGFGGMASTSCGTLASQGNPGGNGATGAVGAAGSPGNGGAVIATVWLSNSGTSGVTGGSGASGGGGGGGGGGSANFPCFADRGGGGGGGGGAGCGGSGGGGGTGGGGSFGIFVFNSAGVTITNNTISTASGGKGGKGGNGSSGGLGGLLGSGGFGADDAAAGGNGGAGGGGGNGGGGSGGAGGPSIGVYAAGLQIGLAANTITVGAGGLGGALGTPNGSAGFVGASTASNVGVLLDITPNAFAFTTQTGVPLSSLRTSNAVTIGGLASTAPIWIAGGEYSIGCNATFTGDDGTIANGDVVCVRHTSSPLAQTAVTTSLFIGGSTASFVSVTELPLVAVLSRKSHGMAGTFDLPIDTLQSISGAVTVEPRIIGSGHTIVFRFGGAITVAGNVSVAPVGTAMATPAGNEVLVSLTNVPNNQRITITLTGVNGLAANPPPISLGFLVGDVNNTRSVDQGDISGVKARSGQSTNALNFQFDVNTSGAINSSDISAVKSRAGNFLQ